MARIIRGIISFSVKTSYHLKHSYEDLMKHANINNKYFESSVPRVPNIPVKVIPYYKSSLVYISSKLCS